MSAPKLYAIVVKNTKVERVVMVRELDQLQTLWRERVGPKESIIIHCGFMRPRLVSEFEFSVEATGRVYYTAALKWALPKEFKSTAHAFIYVDLDDESVPCYLAMNQWGYESDDTTEEIGTDTPKNSESSSRTISEAAQRVLRGENNTPLCKYEIYKRIDENGYYKFNTPEPVHVLDVTLNRETIGTRYSKASKHPKFGKTQEEKYFLLTDSPGELRGWIKTIGQEKPDLFESIQKYGIADDQSYLSLRDNLPPNVAAVLDYHRYQLLLPSISQWDPSQLVKIVPKSVQERHISEIGLPVRPLNILSRKGLSHVDELANFTLVQLSGLPSMGRTSILDICHALKDQASNTIVALAESQTETSGPKPTVDTSSSEKIESLSEAEAISKVPLIDHVDSSLELLDEIDRTILGGRLGIKGSVLTLQEIASEVDLTRERVRQRQNKQIKMIVAREYWDDLIGIRIGQLLIERNEPLQLELLDVEDKWFAGFDDNYLFLASIIQVFTANEIRVIEADGRNVVTRMIQKDWDSVIKNLRSGLKQKVKEKRWIRSDIDQYLESSLSEFSALELTPLLHTKFDKYLQYENTTDEARLVAYGRSAESAISAVLAQAESPLHFTEVARRAGDILGCAVDERTAHNALTKDGVWPYDRGTYGLIRHCRLSESKRRNICRIVENMIQKGAVNKQWHSHEIIDQLRENFAETSDNLNPYTLRMCIEDSEGILFLKRMVWARADSGMKEGDRIDTAESFIQILEEAGEPLSGRELKHRLSKIRGVSESMQIHGNDRLVAVAPNVWGLSDWK